LEQKAKGHSQNKKILKGKVQKYLRGGNNQLLKLA
jgi:hypothetical protein